MRPLKLHNPIILAEDAVQLYKRTSYDDLISFEEDLARIAAVVLVIVESPGSFAELGAFASNGTIRKALKVVIQSEYETTESFVRYGPVERIGKVRGDLGVYPWRMRAGKLVVNSASPHYRIIKDFFNRHLDAVPRSTSYQSLEETKLFYVMYWIVFICLAVSPSRLYSYTLLILPNVQHDDFRNKLFCMQLARWIGREPYSGQDYYYARFDQDPFVYHFKPGVSETKSVARKLEIFAAHDKIEKLPAHIRKVASKAREAKSL